MEVLLVVSARRSTDGVEFKNCAYCHARTYSTPSNIIQTQPTISANAFQTSSGTKTQPNANTTAPQFRTQLDNYSQIKQMPASVLPKIHGAK